MAIDSSFYKNVSLLMQVVPASFECTKYFKKGMFDKPNTTGFIHISHYLLSIYDAKRFQTMVTWPIMNKMDEKQYRMEIKNCIEILASENPDLNFPPILVSHLLQAGGTKFLLLMWKMSQITLRAYLTKKCQIKLLQAPSAGNNIEITQTYFNTMNRKKNIDILKLCENTDSVSETVKQYIQCKSNDLKSLHNAIFEIKKDIENRVPVLPISPLITARLIDIDDTEIINLWKKSVDMNIKVLNNKNSQLRRLDALSSTLCALILDLCIPSKFFDGNDLPKINSEFLSPGLINDKQLVDYQLYKNGNITFHILLLLLNQALWQVESYLRMGELSDLSKCAPHVVKHCETIKYMEDTFQKFIVQVSDNLDNVQCILQEKSINCTVETDFLYPICLETILTSPKLNLSISEIIDNEKLSGAVLISPVQGKYKHLFKRSKCNSKNTPIKSVARYQLNNSIEGISTNWRSPRRQSLIYRWNSPNKVKVSPRYSRLFSNTDSKGNNFRDTNAVSTPNESHKSIISKGLNTQNTDTQIMNIDAAMKNIFDLSCKITDVVASWAQT